MSYIEKVMTSDELGLVDSDVSKDSSKWELFRTQFNLGLNKTSFLALVVDSVKTKTIAQSHKLEEMLKLHLGTLDKKYGLDQIVSSTDKRLKADALKILFASLNMMIESAEVDLESLTESNKSDPEGLEKVVHRAIAVLNTIIRFQHVFWRPNRGTDSSLPPASLEVSHTRVVKLYPSCLALHIVVRTFFYSDDWNHIRCNVHPLSRANHVSQ